MGRQDRAGCLVHCSPARKGAVEVCVVFCQPGSLANSDSVAFTEAMVGVACRLRLGENVPLPAGPGGWDRERRRLLDLAGQRAAERGERLVLVVDGLDDDQGTRPGSGLPSIASCCPDGRRRACG